VDETSASSEEAGFEHVDLGDEARRARAALEKLKPAPRRVLLMSVVDGLTHAEIVTATGLPLGTVKSHIRRGLEQTAEFLRPSKGGEPS
jgi:RNA polymerase sigma-70 factor (ECF subfamily)